MSRRKSGQEEAEQHKRRVHRKVEAIVSIFYPTGFASEVDKPSTGEANSQVPRVRRESHD